MSRSTAFDSQVSHTLHCHFHFHSSRNPRLGQAQHGQLWGGVPRVPAPHFAYTSCSHSVISCKSAKFNYENCAGNYAKTYARTERGGHTKNAKNKQENGKRKNSFRSVIAARQSEQAAHERILILIRILIPVLGRQRHFLFLCVGKWSANYANGMASGKARKIAENKALFT